MIPSTPALPDSAIGALDRRGMMHGLMLAGVLPALVSPAWAKAGEAAATGARNRVIHGITITDPFGWLDDAALDDPMVTQLMVEFDGAANQAMAPLAAINRQLRDEANATSPLSSPPVPVPDGAFGYWSDWSQGRRQLWRIDVANDARQLLLDAEENDTDGKPIGNFVAWGLSPDGAMLAFATVATPEHHDIRFKQIATGELLADVVHDAGVQITSERLVWTADSCGIIYGEVDSSGRPWRARIHWLAKPQAEGPILYDETDPAVFVEIRQTTSGRFAVITAVSVDTAEVRIVDQESPNAVQLVSPRRGWQALHGRSRRGRCHRYSHQRYPPQFPPGDCSGRSSGPLDRAVVAARSHRHCLASGVPQSSGCGGTP